MKILFDYPEIEQACKDMHLGLELQKQIYVHYRGVRYLFSTFYRKHHVLLDSVMCEVKTTDHETVYECCDRIVIKSCLHDVHTNIHRSGIYWSTSTAPFVFRIRDPNNPTGLIATSINELNLDFYNSLLDIYISDLAQIYYVRAANKELYQADVRAMRSINHYPYIRTYADVESGLYNFKTEVQRLLDLCI